MFRKSDWTDLKIEIVIGNLLRAGVTLAATVVVVGGLLFLARYGFAPANYRNFSGEPSNLREWSGIVQAALGLHGRGIIQLGLLLLIATPVARVAFSAFAFAMEKDWLYVGITALVLMILLYSIAGSFS